MAPTTKSDVDFFAETQNEKDDRLVGKTAAQKMNFARKEDVAHTKSKDFRTKLYVYIGVNFVCLVMLMISMLTVSWYHYSGSYKTTSVEGNEIVAKENWALAVNGVAAFVEYCAEVDGECAVDRDEYLYFAASGNEDGFVWPEGAWTLVAAEAATGTTYLFAGVGLHVAANGMASAAMSLAFFEKDTRFRMILGTTASVVAFVSLTLGLAGYTLKVQDFLALLETGNYAGDLHAPTMSFSFSMYLMVAACFCSAVCAVIMFLLIKPTSECPEHLAEVLEKHRTVRGVRTKQYFRDHDATSYTYETSPIDSHAGTAHKETGWTQNVHRETVNVMHAEDDNFMLDTREIISPPPVPEPLVQDLSAKENASVIEQLQPPVLARGFSFSNCLEAELPGSPSQAPLPELPGSPSPSFGRTTSNPKLVRANSLEKLRSVTNKRTRKVTRAPTFNRKATDKTDIVIG